MTHSKASELHAEILLGCAPALHDGHQCLPEELQGWDTGFNRAPGEAFLASAVKTKRSLGPGKGAELLG